MEKDLIIAARPSQGFRRCGVHHPPSEVRHVAGTFSKDQVVALKAEPNLIVVEADPEPAAEGADDPKPQGGKGPKAPAKPAA